MVVTVVPDRMNTGGGGCDCGRACVGTKACTLVLVQVGLSRVLGVNMESSELAFPLVPVLTSCMRGGTGAVKLVL